MSAMVSPERWGLSAGPDGEMMVGAHNTVALARTYGTPLHVIHETRLFQTARAFRESVASAYPGRTSIHYALKCNSVPAVLRTVQEAGLNVEVMTEYELDLAILLGFTPAQIIVNGPCKTETLLRKCVQNNVRLIVVDSLQELRQIAAIAHPLGRKAKILLRVNPDYIPSGMNRGTATGSRTGCAFGLDLKGGEVSQALGQVQHLEGIEFLGYHIHVGTGIRNPHDHAKALRSLTPLLGETRDTGLPIKVLDVGGGFASMTTRELTTAELLLYQGFDRLPEGIRGDGISMDEFAGSIARAVTALFPPHLLPELVYEPGRCIASPNQFLLLTVHALKERPGVRTWLVADGGLSTVTMPTYYEYHEVILCNDVRRPRKRRVTIIGPACFAGDVVYRNKLMPEVLPGEVIAIMDSGAYFTAMESSFGFPRPAIAAVNGSGCRLVRRRETFDEMISRDLVEKPTH